MVELGSSGASRPVVAGRLNSWKEIARHFGRDERTVKRWEAERGLPVHRMPGQARSKIFAEVTELESWLKGGASEAPTAAKPADERAPAAKMSPLSTAVTPRRVGIAALIATVALGVGFAGGTAVRLLRLGAPGSTSDGRALDLYRQGQHDLATHSAPGMSRALDAFTQAIVRDPNFSDAYVGLAETYAVLREYSNLPDAEAYPRAEAAAERAVALNPNSGEAHGILGFVHFRWNWNPDKAEAEFRHALSLAPKSADLHRRFGDMLKMQRRFPEALAQLDTARSLDPASTAVLADKGALFLTMGRLADAETLLRDLEAVEPGQMWPHAYLASLALSQGRYAFYLTEARLAAGAKGDARWLRVIDAAEKGFNASGDEGQGLLHQMLTAQTALVEQGVGSPYDVACTEAQLRDQAAMLTWLHRAVEQHDPHVLEALTDPCLESQRSMPTFGFVRRAVLGSKA